MHVGIILVVGGIAALIYGRAIAPPRKNWFREIDSERTIRCYNCWQEAVVWCNGREQCFDHAVRNYGYDPDAPEEEEIGFDDAEIETFAETWGLDEITARRVLKDAERLPQGSKGISPPRRR